MKATCRRSHSHGKTVFPSRLLLAGVVVWRAVVFMWRLGGPALAPFARFRHGDGASVRSTLAGGTGELWDDGGRLGR